MNQLVQDGSAPGASNEPSRSAFFDLFICVFVSATTLLIQYCLRDLDLRRTISTGTIRKRTPTSSGFPIAQRQQLPPIRHLSIWKAFRLVACLTLLALAVVGVALAEPCAESKHDPDKLDAAGSKHGRKHRKHRKNHPSLCLSESQTSHLALVFFYTYTALLALLSVTLISEFSNTCDVHLTLLLLIALFIDIFALFPTSTHPILAWAQIVLLILTALLIPILLRRSSNAMKYKDPPPKWPITGRLVVQNLSARYAEHEPPVLEDVSFRVEDGEWVGVVGKYGCGKDALSMALLRTIWTEGKVFYDGLSTHTLSPSILSSCIALISGSEISTSRRMTVRHIIDPQTQFDDTVLNEALKTAGLDGVGLKDSVRGLSVRERWCVRFARAIVRKPKLVILDETSISTSYAPDSRFYISLRASLSGSTVLVITSELENLCSANVNKALVLDAGRVSDYDTLGALFQKGGAFRALVDESGDEVSGLVRKTFCSALEES